MNSEVIRVEEAGVMLGLSRLAAYRAVKRGEIPALRFGRKIVIPKAAIERMLRVGTEAEVSK